DSNSREIVLKTAETDAVKAVEIFSIFGQEILNLKSDILHTNELRTSADALSNSVYIVKVYFANGIASRKIIIH
ncbi:MAG: T9SS type A sorting domain-containing protein, partial [Flavobacteriaceae bacterium]|nr:T9SS type A sorting domain-containing protein [Flavobacteriaceae bacterium]